MKKPKNKKLKSKFQELKFLNFQHFKNTKTFEKKF